MKKQTQPNYQELLLNAINPENESRISQAYRVFHNYSILNQMLAMSQMDTLSPIAPFNKWKSLGRSVKKGAKAIALYMPLTIKEKDENGKETGEEKTIFILKRNWFGFTDTKGDTEAPAIESVGKWNKEEAMKNLGINQVEFNSVRGNAQGYAIDKTFALNPMAKMPVKTTFHEMAHIVLGHTDLSNEYASELSKEIKEVEAESTAFICCAVLGHNDNLAEARGYIQSYLSDKEIDKKTAKRIFTTANKIIKSGVK